MHYPQLGMLFQDLIVILDRLMRWLEAKTWHTGLYEIFEQHKYYKLITKYLEPVSEAIALKAMHRFYQMPRIILSKKS